MNEPEPPNRTAVVGVDTGGTFTDLVFHDGARLVTHKLPSSPPAFDRAVVAGCEALLAKAGWDGSFELVHSTTVGTNALLERKGARTALITTEGFRDVLEIGRQARPELYNLVVSKPEPLVPRARRHEVAERVTAGGRVLVPLSDAAIEAALDALDDDTEALAVCLLFSFVHPAHEARIAAAARARGWNTSVSSEILPEFREYERTATTVANAYVAPVMKSYLDRLAAASPAAALRVVQSNGGSCSAAQAAERPVHTLLSGPAAGVIGALAVARQACGREDARVVTFDMGGTSTDVALLDGAAGLSTELDLGGVPVRVPMMDIHTVGAGGGSLAEVDAGGVLRVGPASAGADPGPACYGRGDRATVTDANLQLGRIDPARFLGGRMPLDPSRCRAALDALARVLGIGIDETAGGILRLVNAHMEQAVRVISVERGFDPGRFTLVSFGGAGGLHACALAEALRMPEVLVPAHPGVLSALGCVCADRVRDRARTLMVPLDQARFAEVLGAQHELIDEARAALTEEGFGIGRQVFTASLAARYRGQSFELASPLETTLPSTVAAFHRAHEVRYGSVLPEAEIEVVAVRLRAVGLRDRPRLADWSPQPGEAEAGEGTFLRERLGAGAEIRGPARLLEAYATTHVPEGWTARVDRWGNLRLSGA